MTTKEFIIDAMTEVFSEKGYMASMQDVATIVGIKVPSIYSHYSGKDEIILLSVKKEIENFRNYIQDIYEKFNKERSETLLKEIFFSYIEYFKKEKRMAFWNNFDLIPDMSLKKLHMEEYKQYMEWFVKILKDIFEQGKETGELKREADKEYHLLYIVTLQGILRGLLKFSGSDELQSIHHDKIWDLLWESIKGNQKNIQK